MTRTTNFIAVGLTFAVALPAAPAQAAGAARTFLSAAGSDSNNCINVLTPCRHLAAAYAATASDGEIYVLDPANYGSLSITGPVSIEGHGWASIAPVAGQAAITINAGPGAKINIIGVVLDGTALANTNGIVFNSGGSLTVRDSVIRNFGADGVQFLSSTPSGLFVSNTLISDNVGVGIRFQTSAPGATTIDVSNTLVSHNSLDGVHIQLSGTANVTGTLDRVAMQHNGGDGLNVSGSSQTINVTISDSVSADNVGNGVLVSASGTADITAMVRNSAIVNNATGLNASGSGATAVASLLVTRSAVTGNTAGWTGVVISYGDNNIDDNGSASTAPPHIIYK